ncbi:hypothetical protein EAO71_00905 [Streptomyces sp. ms191]|uniref:hypothetical protein n=1 Tax=Streptomyces sp. ms191 TaxID=1827978 RepID=UPI0011CD6E51|nr:hypothetical protein [Streptomyces sp. ms191]TXS34514.1 hypothetical protein EAO71_00905 [Streptomyces sp. ms191]
MPGEPTRERVVCCSYLRLQDPDGNLLDVCESVFEITARYAAQRRLELLSRSSSIGTMLDVVRTSEELVAVAVPDFADAARVDLAEAVLEGLEQPTPWDVRPPVRTVAHSGSTDQEDTPARDVPADDRRLVLPLKAGAATFGTVTLTRTDRRAPFADADRDLAGELVAHTAVCLDNARRVRGEGETERTRGGRTRRHFT